MSSGAAYTNMSGLSITFTPVHSVVFLIFTASGATQNNGRGAFVECRATNAAGTTVYGGCVSLSDITDGSGGLDAAWNCSMVIPITVTAGTSTTIIIQWTYNGTNTSSKAYCNTSSASNYSHRTMVIWD